MYLPPQKEGPQGPTKIYYILYTIGRYTWCHERTPGVVFLTGVVVFFDGGRRSPKTRPPVIWMLTGATCHLDANLDFSKRMLDRMITNLQL